MQTGNHLGCGTAYLVKKGLNTFFLCLLWIGGWLAGPDHASAQPTITSGPAGQVLSAGGTLTLSVSAGGTPLAYQWYKDSRRLVGATQSTLSVTNAGVINTGMYFVVVSNSYGIVISLPVAVAVGNPSLLAWGENTNGQLGNGTTANVSQPFAVAGNVVTGSAGRSHSQFITADGKLWATGLNASGQLGDGNTIDSHSPVYVTNNVAAVAAGPDSSLVVITNGPYKPYGWYGSSLYVMGYDADFRLGMQYPQTFNTATYLSPTLNFQATYNTDFDDASHQVVAVAAGGYHSFMIMSDGDAFGMGLDNYGQVGDGALSFPVSGPYVSPPDYTANPGWTVAAAAGTYHSLLMQADSTVWTVGLNDHGQLGNGSTNDAWLPVCVASNVTTVAAGAYHSLFVMADGTLWTMGYNGYGQLNSAAARRAWRKQDGPGDFTGSGG